MKYLWKKEVERELGLRHCCLHHFAQFLTTLSVLAPAYWAFWKHVQQASSVLDNSLFDWTSGLDIVSAFSNNKPAVTSWIQNTLGEKRRRCVPPFFGLIEQFSTALLNHLCLMRKRIFCLSLILHQAQLQNITRASDQIILSLTCFESSPV